MTEAEDIVQAVYLRLMTSQPRLQSIEHERAWLIRTAINLCLDYHKSAARQTNVPFSEDIAAPTFGEAGEVLESVWKLHCRVDRIRIPFANFKIYRQRIGVCA
jgi:RNA polymerase sigma-70 factor (ECF subfamily)